MANANVKFNTRLEDNAGLAKPAIIASLPNLVKGAGFRTGKAPLGDNDGAEILDLSGRLNKAISASVQKSHTQVAEVIKSVLSGPAVSQFGMLELGMQMGNSMNSLQGFDLDAMSAMGLYNKSITTTVPLSTGYVPYDLREAVQIIAPYYTVLRNKIARTQGQGTSRRLKLLTGFSGSHTNGANNFVDITTSELSSFATPQTLPNFGSQQAAELSIPYKILQMNEAVSWMAQYTGQGFDDIASLMQLILLEEFTLNEEGQMLYATNSAISTPTVPTSATARSAGAGEVALTGVATNLYIVVTAGNELGETVASSAVSVAVSSGHVVDLQLAPLPTAQAYTNVYVATGTTNPGVYYLFYSYLGGTKLTLQGAVPTGGTQPPTADTGTYAATRYEGFLSTLTGHGITGGVYPSGWEAGYIDQNVGDVLNGDLISTALQGMYQGASGFKADPTDLIGNAQDLANFTKDILDNQSNTAYQLRIAQDEVNNIRAGGAVSAFVNPFTMTILNVLLHPYIRQGTALLASWVVQHPSANVGATVENVMVQDLLSIRWPIVDASFKFGMFEIGAMVFQAPQYWGILQGLQVHATTPYS